MEEHVPSLYRGAVAKKKKKKFLPDLNNGAHFKLIESRGHYFHFSAFFCPFRSAASFGGAVTLNFSWVVNCPV